MANPGDFAYTVKQQADIVRIVGEYVKLRRSGAQNFSGLCPFHNEKTGSFSVHATRQFYHCFGCGASGDVFSFVQKIENITFPEAVRAVAQKLGIPLPKVTFSSPEEAREAKQRGALLDIHERACAFFQEQLRKPEGAHAREYLTGRGLDTETIARFRIGYAPDSGFLLRDFLKKDFDEETLRASGLFSWKEVDARSAMADGENGPQRPSTNDQRPSTMYSKFRNRVLFPICNEGGKVIAFTGRTLSTDEKTGPKYLNSPETPIYSKSHVLFNLDKAKQWVRQFDYAILVEGQMDCISLFAAGIQNVIASSGTAFTEVQARLLARLSKRIFVNFDPDTAGAAAAERSLALLVQEDFQIKVVTLEPGFDPDLFIRRKGKQAYAEVLRGAPKYFDYLIERARSQFPVHTPEGKVKAVNYLLPHIQRISGRIMRDELANEMAQKLGIDSAALRQDLRHAAVRRTAEITATQRTRDMLTQIDTRLVRALMAEDGNFDLRRRVSGVLLRENLHAGLLTESLLTKLANVSDDQLESVDLTEEEKQLRALALMPPKVYRPPEPLTEEAIDAAFAMQREKLRLQRRRSEISNEIVQAQRRNDMQLAMHLLREQVQIDRALRSAATPGTATVPA